MPPETKKGSNSGCWVIAVYAALLITTVLLGLRWPGFFVVTVLLVGLAVWANLQAPTDEHR